MQHAPPMPEPRAPREPLVASGEIQPHAADMAVVASADVTLGDVQSALAEHGQWLAVDGDASWTLRELVDHDSTGPLRLGFGGWRDLMTGCQFTTGSGDLITAGGLPVKNVAGYDLCKLIVGSHGCFGTAQTYTLRTYRQPEAAMSATLKVSPEHVAQTVSDQLASPAPPTWMLLTPAGLHLGWLGRGREIDKLAPIARETVGAVDPRSLDDDIADRADKLAVHRHGQSDGLFDLVRLCVPPARSAEVAGEIDWRGYAIDPVFGIAWIAPGGEAGPWPALAAARRLGGHGLRLRRLESDQITVESEVDAPAGHIASRADDYGVNRASAEILRRLKKQFDPDNRLPALSIGG